MSFALLISANGSAHDFVHIYDQDSFSFREVGNAFLLSGGIEGNVASFTAVPLTDNSIPSSNHDGRSYIRDSKQPLSWFPKYDMRYNEICRRITPLSSIGQRSCTLSETRKNPFLGSRKHDLNHSLGEELHFKWPLKSDDGGKA